MRDFRKKPVVIQAEAWMGTTEQHKRLFEDGIIKHEITKDGSCIIPTLEGDMKCNLNDWIIKGVNGEHYPCKPDIFEKTYDVVTGDQGSPKRVLSEPANHTLIECFEELKFGRPVISQNYLQECIDYLKSKLEE